MKLLHLVLPLALIAAPALAMGTRPNPVMPGNQSVPSEELKAFLAEGNALYQCNLAKTGDVYAGHPSDFTAFDKAFSEGNLAAKPAMNNYPRFVEERGKLETELARLRPKYGC